MDNIIPDPNGRAKHWLVDGQLVAGPETAGEVSRMLEEMANCKADPEPPSLTANDVRAEARRRVMLLLGARDLAHMDVIISNDSREAIRLLRRGKANWTDKEAARAMELEKADLAIEAIRTASNVLEVINEVPTDYSNDKHWP